MSANILSCQLLHVKCTKNLIGKGFQYVKDLKVILSSEMTLLDASYIILYYWSVVTTSTFCTVSKISTLFTAYVFGTSWVLRLFYDIYAFWFLSKHALANISYTFEATDLERSQIVQVIFKITEGHWCWRHSIGHLWFLISFPFNISTYRVPFFSKILQLLYVMICISPQW